MDLLTTRRVVGILPKPTFYSLFETLKQKPESKIIIFKPNDDTDYHHTMVGLVETGELRLGLHYDISEWIISMMPAFSWLVIDAIL